jgi:WXG100 family type VII secretion target
MSSKHTELVDVFQRLNRDIGLFSESFQGSAATTFGSLLADWFKAVNGNTTTLQGLGSYLESAASTFESVDQSLSSGLGGAAGAGGATGVGGGGRGGGPGGGGPPGRTPPPMVVTPPPGTKHPVGPPPAVPRPERPPTRPEIQERLVDLRERHEQIGRRIALIERRIQWKEEELNRLGSQMAELQAYREAVVARGGSMQDLAAIDQRMEQARSQISETYAGMDALLERQQNLIEARQAVEVEYNQLASKIDVLPIDAVMPHSIAKPGQTILSRSELAFERLAHGGEAP